MKENSMCDEIEKLKKEIRQFKDVFREKDNIIKNLQIELETKNKLLREKDFEISIRNKALMDHIEGNWYDEELTTAQELFKEILKYARGELEKKDERG